MPLFETKIQINPEIVSKIVAQHWQIEVGKIMKASQNHTFQASSADKSMNYAVRVTPDPDNIHLDRIKDEVSFVSYLGKAGLDHICRIISPLQKQDSDYIIHEGNLIIVVFQWAQGALLNFMEFQWMKDKHVVKAWGRFFAQLHTISRKFTIDFPEIAGRIQRWDQVHHAILAGTVLHPEDQAVVTSTQHYGVLHGDLNCSNFFYVKEHDKLSVFDTDQVQQGLYLWDVSQAVFTIVMLQQAGLPVSGKQVPEANKEEFQGWLIEGYESVAGENAVDRPRLERMINLKRQFYRKFCEQAAIEGNIPADMAPFINYINDWFKKKGESK